MRIVCCNLEARTVLQHHAAVVPRNWSLQEEGMGVCVRAVCCDLEARAVNQLPLIGACRMTEWVWWRSLHVVSCKCEARAILQLPLNGSQQDDGMGVVAVLACSEL